MSRARRYSECVQGLCKTRARYVADLCKKHIDRMPYPCSIRARSVQLTCKKYARFMSTKMRDIAMFLSDGCITIDNMKAIRDDISTGTRRDMTSIRPPHSFPMPTSRIASDDPIRRRRSPRRTRMRRAKNFAFDIVAEALWPTRCAICDKPGFVVCDDCSEHIDYIDVLSSCPRCGSPYGSVQCCECNDVAIDAIGLDSFPFDRLASAVRIDDDSKRLVTVYKDHDEHRLAPLIAKTMSRYINPDWIDDANNTESDQTFITFIPATAEALNRRGFDHMEKIAELVAKYAHLRSLSVFERPKSLDQRKLNRRERAENMKQKFQIRADVELPSKLIVIDDICTTGSTMFGAALSLREGGCEKLFGLTFGKVC